MYVKRSIFNSDMENPSSFQLELRNGSFGGSTTVMNFNPDLMNNYDKRPMTTLTPSLTMLIIFVIPTILILFCLCVGYYCRKWAQQGQTLSRFPSRTNEVDSVVTSQAPLTPPPAYPDDKPPSYDEALKKEVMAAEATTMSQSQQRLC